jgi:hypothetical protein
MLRCCACPEVARSGWALCTTPAPPSRPAQLSERLSEAQARLQALMSKQGRASQFSSQGERDTFLKARRALRGLRAPAAACGFWSCA